MRMRWALLHTLDHAGKTPRADLRATQKPFPMPPSYKHHYHTCREHATPLKRDANRPPCYPPILPNPHAIILPLGKPSSRGPCYLLARRGHVIVPPRGQQVGAVSLAGSVPRPQGGFVMGITTKLRPIFVLPLFAALVFMAACGSSTTSGGSACDPAYPSVGIPSPPPDLNCGNKSHRYSR